jgi:pimeloyl-ACP methyl ester carboxylesterase
MDKLFAAYSGDEPFTFVIYAHADKKIVYPEIQRLSDQGFRLWYDEGIPAGKNWRASTGDYLLGAHRVLFYISQHSLGSDHCNREINLALDEGKQVIPIYLEDVGLTSDLKIGLNRVQALHPEQDVNYQQHLLNALGQPNSNAEPLRAETNQKRISAPVVVGVIGVLLSAAIALGYYNRDILMFTLVVDYPWLFVNDPIKQKIGFTTTPDGTRIAYATSGEGPPVVQVLGFGTHIESGVESPLYDNDGVIAMTSRDHLFVRYDGRGFGMSDRGIEDFSLPARVSDLRSVVDALGLERFDILAISAGGPVGISFAAQYPERVSRLVLAGAYASSYWMDDENKDYFKRMTDLFETDWERPTVTNLFVSKLLTPNVNDLELKIVGELLRRSANGDDVAAFFRAHLAVDTREQARQIDIPTLVIQATDDEMVTLAAGSALAALIPGARLELVTGGHMASSGSSPEVRRLTLDFFEGVE